ncbi:MAG: class I SAM-dependent methyltransferase [Planctomycetaceae bacterium]|nr:class I SAM-dependent methyltransferase [Planctomycetaceae bacterium]
MTTAMPPEDPRPEMLDGHLYDYPAYYDLVFGSDCAAELSFLEACFERFTDRVVSRVFEPACGTGRLLYRLARRGYSVSGNDLNPSAIEYCNARFQRAGLPPPAIVGDMADFRLKRKVDAAFNTINSFRHLDTEAAAGRHLCCVGDSLARGGIYLLGLHLTPTHGLRDMGETWTARRGHLGIVSDLQSLAIDLRRRVESFRMTFDIYTPTRHRRIAGIIKYRTYTLAQIRRLVASVPSLEWIESFDFSYDVSRPVVVDEQSEDVVLVLRKR